MTEHSRQRRRVRATRARVKAADRAARVLITVGGVGTIVVVSVLCVFLVWVAVPLFLPARLEPGALEAAEPGARAALGSTLGSTLGVDEQGTTGWSLSRSGELVTFALADGRELSRRPLVEGAEPSAVRVASAEGRVAFGFGDGTVRLGRISFADEYLDLAEAPAELAALAEDECGVLDGAVVERARSGALRRIVPAPELDAPAELAPGSAVRLLDALEGFDGPVLAALAGDGILRVSRGTRRENLMTGESTLELEGGSLALDFEPRGAPPAWLGLTGLGDEVWLAWEDGTVWRCDAGDLADLRVVEKHDLLEDPRERATAWEFLIGRSSLVVGDDTGRARVWFRSRFEGAGTPDGVGLVLAHQLDGGGAAVTSLAASARRRMFAVGHADGALRLYHSTSELEVVETVLPGGGPVERLALAPKDDFLLAGGAAGPALWRLDAPHTEVAAAALFAPVWYEGYPGPEHVWQSSGGDDSEPKLGMLPLVFGTIKATFYSLLFGVPIALLAALYTSEFLSPRAKARVKPAIETMASLPSVVLGFLAALVLAPLVEDVVLAVLAAVALVPAAAALGGATWRLLPAARGARVARARLALIALSMALGALAAARAGPVLERALFGGDFRAWLGGGPGGATGGWMILLAPIVGVLTWSVLANRVTPALLRSWRGRSRESFARLDLAKLLASAAAFLALLWAASAALAALGLDPRGGFLDTYVQRNSLVVGFVMGFAIVPIVYTIAEDALAAVPDHLRAASLGAGATPWQTAVRVVLPTAMSGIFSAVMIGFGRAVGETMIVLMAAGNTPLLEWNAFNGFRTLSANIAVELPEAVRGSTHYRTLFLSALVLFAMTSVLNTAAELVRLRYRRRRVQL